MYSCNNQGIQISRNSSEITIESEKASTQSSHVSVLADSESQTVPTQTPYISDRYNNGNIRAGNVPFHIPNVSSVKYSERCCFICHNGTGRSRVPYLAVIDVWIQRRIFVPPKNRCCKSHLAHGLFSREALSAIEATNSHVVTTGLEMSKWMQALTDQFLVSRNFLDFEPSSRLTEAEFDMLLGLSKKQFEELFSYTTHSLRNTKLRYLI